MIAVLQRVSRAAVTVDGQATGSIASGLVVLLGVHKTDTETDVKFLVEKSANLRIFSDSVGKMNLSLLDTTGAGRAAVRAIHRRFARAGSRGADRGIRRHDGGGAGQ